MEEDMSELGNKSKTNFAGTYFDRDSVLRLARLANTFAWASLLYYVAQAGLSITSFTLQVARGIIVPLGFTDFAQQILWLFQPSIPGLWNFIGLQAVGQLLLIFMDMEDNSRRAARK
jgi:hypothetical protein